MKPFIRSKSILRAVACALMVSILFSLPAMALEGDLSAVPQNTPAPAAARDVSAILTEKAFSVKQNGQAVEAYSTLDNTTYVTAEVRFRVPVAGDYLEPDAVVNWNDTAVFAVARGFSLVNSNNSTHDLMVESEKIGTVKFTQTTATANTPAAVTATVTFDGDPKIFDGTGGCSDVFCTFDCTLQYDAAGTGGTPGNYDVTVLEKPFVVNVPAPPVDVAVTKSGARTGQIITWTVKAGATQAGIDYDMKGYQFKDDLTAVGAYVNDSFTVNNGSAIPELAGNVLSYTFPEGASGTQTITYQTKISDDVFFANGDKSIKNTAAVYDGETLKGEATETVAFSGTMIEKTGAISDATGRTITYTITANQLGASLANAVITDVLDTRLTWVSAVAAGTFSDNSASKIFAAEPTGGKYALGDINGTVTLTITAKLDDNLDSGHTLHTIKNKASFSWDGHAGVDSGEVNTNIGINPIKKTAGAYDPATRTIPWTVTVGKSDVDNELRVLDLLVYADSGFDASTTKYTIDGNAASGLLQQVTQDDLKALTPRYGQKYNDDFAGEGLSVTKYVIKNDNHAVADLLVVTGKDASGISVADGDKTFTYTTTVTDPKVYLNNATSGNAMSRIYNTATLFSGSTKLNESTASAQCGSPVMNKDVLPRTALRQTLTQPNVVNTSGGNAANSFDYEDKSVLYRLHINAAGIENLTQADAITADKALTTLGDITITDTLPAGWEFKDVANGKKYLLFQGTGNGKTVTAGSLVSDSTAIISNAVLNGQNASFTFSALDGSYLLVLRAGPTEETAKGYFNKNGSTKPRNTAALTAQNTTASATDSEDVTITGKLLSKTVPAAATGGAIRWTVDYQAYNLAARAGETLIDTVPQGVELRLLADGTPDVSGGNITIHEMTLHPDGSYTQGAEQTVQPGVNVTYDAITRTLTFIPQDNAKSYRYTYITDVTAGAGTTITNRVEMSNTAAQPVRVEASFQSGNDDASATMQRSGSLKITKRAGGVGDTLQGTQYTLYAQDGSTIVRQGDTDAKGELTMRSLPVGSYILQETNPPTDYLVSLQQHPVTVTGGAGNMQTLVGSEKSQITLYNWHKDNVGDLSVSTTIGGNAADPAKSFRFTLKISDLNDTFAWENGTVTFTNGVAVFTLRGGQSLTLRDLPALPYTLTQEDYSADGYSTTTANTAGTIARKTTTFAAFNNVKNADGTPAAAPTRVAAPRTGDTTLLFIPALGLLLGIVGLWYLRRKRRSGY